MLCRQTRVVSAFILFWLLGSSLANAQFPGIPAAGQGNPYRPMVLQKVQQELDCMKLVAGLTAEQADTIIGDVDELIDTEAAKMGDAIQAGDNGAMFREPKALIEAVVAGGKKVLPPEAFKKLEADIALRTKFQTRSAQRGLVASLDDVLQLSNDQQGKLAKLMVAEWSDDWNAIGLSGAQAGSLIMVRDQLKSLPQDKLKMVLRDSQLAVLEEIMNMENPNVGDPIGFAELQGKAMATLRVEETVALCKLTEKQQAKLQVAADTAVTESIAKKREAMKELQGGNMSVLAEFARPIGQMIFQHEAWKTAFEEELNAEQVATYTARQESRQKRKKTAMTATMANGLGMQLGGLTGKQRVEMSKLLDQHLSTAAGPMEQSMQMVDIPEADYKKILNDEQWERFSQLLGMMKMQRANMEAK